VGYWETQGPIYRAVADERVTGDALKAVKRTLCPCGGELDRIAFRDRGTQTRQWVAFGYRCYTCSMIYVEAGR